MVWSFKVQVLEDTMDTISPTPTMMFMGGFKEDAKSAKYAALTYEDLEAKQLQDLVLEAITARTKYKAVWVCSTAFWYHFPTSSLLC